MRANTPQGLDASRRRSSLSQGHRQSLGSSIPRVRSRIDMARAENQNRNQPSFDFMTGEAIGRPPSRSAFGASFRGPSGDHKRDLQATETDEVHDKRRKELEQLKAEVNTLKYTIDNHKQEEELARLRSESELRDARRKAEEDFKQRQAAEGDRNKAIRQHESLQKEMSEIRNNVANERAALERQVRELSESKRQLEEEVEDLKSENEEGLRSSGRKAADLESRNQALQRNVEELQQDSDQREILLQDVQQQLAERDVTVGNMEAEILRLKAQTGDAETLAIIKKELSEQVTYIRTLEAEGRELRHLKKLHKSIEVVEEEKRSLQRKVDAMNDLQNELGEAKMQRQRLEDERLAWTAYLQSQAGADGELEFDSPETLARALVTERFQTATSAERIGALESEIMEKDSTIESLQGDKLSLVEEIEKLKVSTAATSDNKARLRLERQRSLAIKEVEYLRAQLKTFDTEDITYQPENVDEAKNARIEGLDRLVDQYRQEVQALQAELASTEAAPQNPLVSSPIGLKRSRDTSEEENERLGVLSRKNRKLQDDLSALQTNIKLLEKELSVCKERLKAAAESSKTRIISLRSNPTSDFEAIKQSTLDALKSENADLLSQLSSGLAPSSSVPLSALTASQRGTSDAYALLASEKTRNDRLKKVWAAKTNEFRQAISSLLGWDIVFLPDGKTKVTSYYFPSTDEEENSIVFDGERGTMKVSGGAQSEYAKKIMNEITYWVGTMGCIPGLLAALTLKFHEEKHKDGTVRMG